MRYALLAIPCLALTLVACSPESSTPVTTTTPDTMPAPMAPAPDSAAAPDAVTPDTTSPPPIAPDSSLTPSTPDTAPAMTPDSATLGPGTPAAPTSGQNQQTLYFNGPMDLDIVLTTEDNFQTATMTDNSDRQISLRSVPAASGMRLESANGEFIHLKGSEGVVQLTPGNPIEIKEFRR